MPKIKCTKEEREETLRDLRKMCPPGSTVYCILRHRSRSGMQRRISLVVLRKDMKRQIDYMAAKVMGYSVRDREEGIVIGGCGMDMGFALVYDLGRTLYPKGGPLSKSNGIRQVQAKRDDPKAERETDGGYLLKHEWL